MPLRLANVLGLRPLDRVQVNDAHEIREMGALAQIGCKSDLPFLYFQRVREDGLLEVRSPGGYVTSLAPADVCDVRFGDPMIVRAMPHAQFMTRSRLPVDQRQGRPGDESYAPAYVLYAQKDRWGRVDQVGVWFLDPALNGDKPFHAPVHDDDRACLAQKATRMNMPEMAYRFGAPASADKGLQRERDMANRAVRGFIKASRRGNVLAV